MSSFRNLFLPYLSYFAFSNANLPRNVYQGADAIQIYGENPRVIERPWRDSIQRFVFVNPAEVSNRETHMVLTDCEEEDAWKQTWQNIHFECQCPIGGYTTLQKLIMDSECTLHVELLSDYYFDRLLSTFGK